MIMLNFNKTCVFGLVLFAVFSFVPAVFFSCSTTDESASAEASTKAESPAAAVKSEYERSVGNVKVSESVFKADKSEILAIIADLAVIMQRKEYKKWEAYLTPESKKYWSTPKNLIAVVPPGRQSGLKNMPDYFLYVFIPSRTGARVDEIRYMSETSIKAVHREDNRDVIYYYFKKVDGKWFLSIDGSLSSGDKA